METRKRLIALHGAGMDASFYGSLAMHLTDHYLEAFTMPGHEKQGTVTPLLPTIEDMAGWLRQTLASERAAAERRGKTYSVTLIGHSMGALVALAAADDPAVKGIIAMGAAPKMPVNQSLLDLARDAREDAFDLILKWGLSPRHLAHTAVRTVMRDLMSAIPDKALYNDLHACMVYGGARATDKPLLVISGEDDRLTPAAEGAALAAYSSRGLHTVIEACGHMMPVERPAETSAATLEFIEEL